MRNIQFKDFVTLQRGFDLTRKDMEEGPFPVVGSTSIVGWHNQFKKEPPGVITGRSGSLGTVQFINTKYWPHNTALWVKDFKDNLPKYVYYYLKDFPLENFNSGAGVPTLNRNHLGNYEISIHDLTTQHKIAAILSTYDDLIENNTRRIKILEEMAHRIYREWFVDFRYPGHENDKLVESELGMIPEGWEVKELGEKIIFKRGKNITKKQIVDGDVPVIAAGINPSYFHNKSNVKSPVVTISASGANAGIINLYLEDIWASDCAFINQEIVGTIYYYYSLVTSRQVEITGLQRGSAQPHVYPKDISRLIIVDPTEKLISKFEELAEPLFNEIRNFRMKNKNLRQTRDLLLPKLISGKVDVSKLKIRN